MRPTGSESVDWIVRLYVYHYIVEHGRPPAVDETAAALRIDEASARTAYARLHERHAVFLEPGTLTIRMAHPFSGVPTLFRVHTGGRTYFANCAWDALGIPAVLGADATIEASCSDSGEALRLGVEADVVRGHRELIHFALPFRRWYEDLIFT